MKNKLYPQLSLDAIVEELEPRLLFSGGIEGVILDDRLSQPATYIDIDSQTDQISDSNNNAAAIEEGDSAVRRELVFIDTRVDNYQELLNDILAQDEDNRHIEVVMLESSRNGVEQITEVLAQQSGLDAVHLVSHGTNGTVNLGNVWLDINNLDGYAVDVSGWNNALGDDADLLIYGCDLASNADGQSLINALSDLTGTDVAASIDDTGQAELGGDWNLEYTIGSIETGVAFSEQAQQNWTGLLAYQTYRDEFNAVDFANSDGSQDWSGSTWQEIGESNGAGSGLVRITTLLGEQGLEIRQSGMVGALRQVDLSGATIATLNFDYARFGLDDASDYVVLEISANGGGSWSELDRFEGPADDMELIFTSYDVSSYIASNTQIRFVSSGITASESLFVDNVQIAYASGLSSISEFLVIDTPAGVQETSAENRGSHQAVAVDSSGDYVVAWSDDTADGNGWGVFARQFNSDGTAKGMAFQVNIDSANDQQWATVTADAAGRFAVVWSSQNQDGSGQGIYLRRFNAGGTAIDTNDILVNSGITANNQLNPSVAVNATGDIVIAWEGDGAGTEGIYAKRFNMTSPAPGDQVPGVEILVDSPATAADPSVDINSSGNFVITWHESGDLWAQRFDSGGSPVGGRIGIDIIGQEERSVVALHDNDEFTVAYRSNFSGFEGIWVRRYDDTGSPFGFASKVNTGASDHTSPSIAKDSAGNFLIAWEGTGDADQKGVYARVYDASGTPQGSQFLVNQTESGDQHLASAAMLDPNNFVVVWSGEGPGDTSGVFARQFGTAFSSGIMLSTSGDVTSSGTPGLNSWEMDDVLSFGDPNLSLGPGTSTDGTFSLSFDVTNFGTNDNVKGLHYVRSNLWLGSGPTPGPDSFELNEGDLLITLNGSGSYTGTGGLTSITVDNQDVFVFRPDNVGDYSTGQFYYLLDDAIGDNIRGISLVESASVSIGDGPALAQGTFLFSEQGVGDHDNIYTYVAATVGDTNTTSTLGKQLLLDGENGDLNFSDQIQGIHVIEANTNLGGVNLFAGDLLVTLNKADSVVGGGTSIAVEEHDIFVLRMTATEQGASNQSIGSAVMLFDGSNVGMMPGDTNEDLDALTLTVGASGNSAPTATANTNTIAEDAASPVSGNVISDDDGFGVDSDPDIGDTLNVTQVNSEINPANDVTGSYGTLDWNSDGSYTYTIDNGNPAVQALDVGQTLNDVFTYTISDGNGGNALATLTITITGAEDAPVIGGTAIGNVTEDGTLSANGTLTITDVDTSDNPISWPDEVSTLGDNGYGNFALTSGTWTYTLDNTHAAVQALDVGETLNDTHAFTASDGSTQVVAITITGAEDAPVIGGTSTGTVIEDGTLTANGTLAISDVDTSDNPISFGDVASTAGDNGFGNFALTAGTWTYTLDNANAAVQALDVSESLTDTFTFTANDGSTQTVIVTINGAEDAPVIGGTSTGTVAEDGTLTANGALTISDVDISDNPISFGDVALTGGDNGYGNFALTGGTWTYTLDNPNAAVQALDVGESLTDTYTFTASDGSTQVVAITINGAEDAPVIGGTSTGTVAEDGTLTANGTLTISDVDTPDNPISFADVGSTLGDNGYGDFELTSGTWTYTLDNAHAAVQALDVGDTLNDTHTFTASDGSTQVVTITINGTEDAPVVDLDASAGGLNYSTTFTEDAGAVQITDTDVSVFDAEGDDVTLTLVAGSIADGASEVLTFGVTDFALNADLSVNNITVGGVLVDVSYVTATQTFTVTDDTGNPLTAAEAIAVLEDITYRNDSDTPSTGAARTISITADDGTDLSVAAVSTITVVASNDPTTAVADENSLPPFSGDYTVEGSFQEGPKQLDEDTNQTDLPQLEEPVLVVPSTGNANPGVLFVSNDPLVTKQAFKLTNNVHDANYIKDRLQAASSSLWSNTKSRLIAIDPIITPLPSMAEFSGFVKELDQLRMQVQEMSDMETVIVGSSVGVATGLSIGYIVWLVRGGVLLSSILSSMPAWRMIDPLPVIAYRNDRQNKSPVDQDSLDTLIKKGIKIVKSKLEVTAS